MGLGGISIWQLAIVLLIVVLIFGTKRLKSIGSDLGGAIKGFKKAMDTDEDKPSEERAEASRERRTGRGVSRARRRTRAAAPSTRLPRCSTSVFKSSFSSPSSGCSFWGRSDYRR